MDLTIGPDEEQIADSARQFITGMFPITRLHQGPGTIGAEMCSRVADMGWHAIALPEELGGLGMSVVEEALIFCEVGRGLAPASILGSALAAHAAALAGLDGLAAELISGEKRAAIAIFPGGPPGSEENSATLYDWGGASVALSVTPDGTTLFDLAGVEMDARPSLDKSISMARGRLRGDAILAEIADKAIYRRAVVGVSAMQVGLAEGAVAMIVEYAKIRVTFGKPIGSYQAVRHVCADMAVRCEAARAQLFYAAIAIRDSMPDADLLMDAAHAVAHEAAARNVDDNIQLHGGVGITEEHDAPLFMKRAQVLGQWFGTHSMALDRIAAVSGRELEAAQG